MGFFDLFRRKSNKESDDIGSDDFMARMEAMIQKIKEEEGTDLNELPHHEGPYGLSKDKPDGADLQSVPAPI